MQKIKFLSLCFLAFTWSDTFAQDCTSKISVDKFTKEKSAILAFDRESSDKKKLVTLSIKTLDDKMNCFLMDFFIFTYTGKPDFTGMEGKTLDVLGKSFTFYFLFDNNQSIRIDSKPYIENSSQFSFCKSDYQNLITNLSSNKLTDLRIVTYTSDNTSTDWHVPTDKQNFFIEVFKCFNQTN